MIRRLLLTLGLALLVLGTALPAAAQSGNARVRVVHASPDAPAVDVFVDGQPVLTNVAFFTASNYLDVPAGTRRVQVAPAGQGAGAAVIDASPSIAAGQAYTVAAVGLVADNTIKAQVYNDNLSAPPSGQAKVRVIHASPDAPAVAVKVAGGDTLLPSLAFPNASDYLTVPAASYNLQVTPASDLNTTVLDLANTRVQAGTIYDVFAVGQLANIRAEVKTTPASSTRVPSMMPNTGIEDTLSLVLVGFGLLLLAGGLFTRRRVA